MRYIAFLLLLCLNFSCSDNDSQEECNICTSDIQINGEPWEVIDRNVFRETIISGESIYTIGLNSRHENGFMFIKDDLSIVIDNRIGDTLTLVTFEHSVNVETALFTYLTSKSDGDVQGSYYKLDPTYNNFIVLEEVTEIYLKANFQAKLLKVIPENDSWPEDPAIIEFTNAKIIASREE
jgi:hypothetical protein